MMLSIGGDNYATYRMGILASLQLLNNFDHWKISKCHVRVWLECSGSTMIMHSQYRLSVLFKEKIIEKNLVVFHDYAFNRILTCRCQKIQN